MLYTREIIGKRLLKVYGDIYRDYEGEYRYTGNYSLVPHDVFFMFVRSEEEWDPSGYES